MARPVTLKGTRPGRGRSLPTPGSTLRRDGGVGGLGREQGPRRAARSAATDRCLGAPGERKRVAPGVAACVPNLWPEVEDHESSRVLEASFNPNRRLRSRAPLGLPRTGRVGAEL